MFCSINCQVQLISVIICLHHCDASFFVQFLVKSAPTKVWVARSRGLPRSTIKVSHNASSLWHFQEYSSIEDSVAIFSAVNIAVALAYCLAKHEHYKHLSLCEHGLSSA